MDKGRETYYPREYLVLYVSVCISSPTIINSMKINNTEKKLCDIFRMGAIGNTLMKRRGMEAVNGSNTLKKMVMKKW